MTKKCLGCGVVLQFDKPEKEGYIEPGMLERANICRRCFRIKCYGDYVFINKDDDDYVNMMKKINETDDLVLYLVDIFNINNSIKEINKYINNPIILVLSKRDLLPKSVKPDKIVKWILQYNLKVIDVVTISSNKNYNLDVLFKKINKYKKSNNIYVVGNTNAGKSTLINSMIKNYTNHEPYITTSILPTTTLEMMEIKLNDNITLIDTPGLLDEGNITNILDYMTLKRVVPKKEVKPLTYPIKPNQSLLINNLVRVDYKEGITNSFTIYISNEITVDKINTDTNDKLTRLKKHQLDIDGDEDVVINGLGWIKIVKPCKINIYLADKISVYKRGKII
jgi:30S ribosome assembly GTPase